MSEYGTLRQTSGSRHYNLVKEVKKFLGVAWRTPLTERFGGPLTVQTEELHSTLYEHCRVATTFGCGSTLYINESFGGLVLCVNE